MINSIGSSAFTHPVSHSKSGADLESQLKRYKEKLADWVNCPSCKTPEGKAKIEDLSNKISDIRARIEMSSATINAPSTSLISAANSTATTAFAPVPAGPESRIQGSRLDVLA